MSRQNTTLTKRALAKLRDGNKRSVREIGLMKVGAEYSPETGIVDSFEGMDSSDKPIP